MPFTPLLVRDLETYVDSLFVKSLLSADTEQRSLSHTQ